MSGTVRQQKYSKLILKELSDIFLKQKFNILDNASAWPPFTSA
jgi:hypothetical protein